MMNLPNRVRAATGMVLLTAATFLVLLVLSAGPSYAQPKPIKSSSASRFVAWQTELKAWEQRWSALTAQGSKAESAKWSALEADLKASANRFGQRTEEHVVHKQTTDKTTTLGALSPCPPRDDRPGYCCYLFPGPDKTVCRYVCTPCKTSSPKP